VLRTILHRVSTSSARLNGAHPAASLESAANGPSGVRALLYDADGEDRELALDDIDLAELDERGLLWIDITDLDQVERAAAVLGVMPDTGALIARSPAQADVVFHTEYFHVSVVVAERTKLGYEPASLHCIAGENWIVTVHETPLDFLERFNERIKGDSMLGGLDAAGLVAVFLHEHLAGYLREIEPLEIELDRLDLQVMTGRGDDVAVLRQLVAIRRRLARLRRLLAPHRELYGRLALPDFELLSDSNSPESFASLAERSEQALQALDATREMIVNSFDIYTTWTAHETTKVMKLLTVASVTLLPPTLLASVMGMNSLPPALTGAPTFVVTLCLMFFLGAAVLTAARWRRWI
jgi:magnesium transporter